MNCFAWLRKGQRLVVVAVALFTVWALAIVGPFVVSGSSPLVVTKTASVDTVAPNGPVTYSAVFSNPTGSDVVLTRITDSLPSGFRFVGMSPTSDITQTSVPPMATGVITWAGPITVSGGKTVRVDYYVLASENARETPYENAIQAETQGHDVTVVASAPVTVAAPNISVTKTVTPSEVIEPKPVTYTVYVSNTGNAVGAVNSIEDLLPTGFTFDQILYPVWWPNFHGATGVITWNNAFTVAAGSVYTISYRVTTGDAASSAFVNVVTATLNTSETPHGQVAVTVKPAVYLTYLPLVRKAPPPPANILAFDGRVGTSDWEIYTVKADGTELSTLTNNQAGDWGPRWSGDGKKIIFASFRDGNRNIYTMNANGDNQTNITPNNPLLDDQADWSPSNDRIVYQSRRSNIQGGSYAELFTANPDGSAETNVTYSLWEDWDPHFSPDGKRVAYVGGLTIYADIWVANADGSGQYRLTNNQPKHDRAPSWSPDGSRIVFVSADWDKNNNRFKPETAEIWVVSADGSSRTQLTNDNYGDLSPHWSPDGSKIVFSSNRGGNYDIWVMNADGSGMTRLTTSSAGDYAPAWSADGSKIAFVSYRDGNEKRLYVMNADGSDQHKVSDTLRDVVHFAWIGQGTAGQTSSLLGSFGLPDSLANVAQAEYWLSQVPK